MIKVSIIIVNFNGLKWLKKCLDSITSQTYTNYEVIFVDNNSTDSSVEFVKKNYINVKIVQNIENYGFAKGNNLGYAFSKGEYIILLNNDTYVEKDYIEKFINVFKEFPKCGVAQSKIVLMDNPKKLDSAGSFLTNTIFLYHFGYGKDSEDARYNKPYKIFSAKGASMIIKREVIEKVGLFDDDFWCYYEETDFCHRVLNSSYDVVYYPKPVCYHMNGTTSSKFRHGIIIFHSEKNRISSYLKNMRIKDLIYYLGLYTLLLPFISGIYLIKGSYSSALSFYKAYIWNILNIRNQLSKRSKILRDEKVKYSAIIYNPDFSYYYYLVFGLDKYIDTYEP